MDIKHDINHKLFLQREENTKHLAYEREFGFYKAIASGNVEDVKKRYQRYLDSNRNSEPDNKNGILSKDPVQNLKYHFAILAALVSRFCVEKGLEREVAYNMTDVYIQRVDSFKKEADIDALQEQMIMDFTERMRACRKKDIYSKQIAKCVDYIYDNLHKRIKVGDIAAYLNMTPAYLSKLFSKEVGMPLSTYIREQRLEAAAQMLQFSDYSIAEIADYFVFSSQSHFTSAFQEKYDMTPKKYRDTHSNHVMPV